MVVDNSVGIVGVGDGLGGGGQSGKYWDNCNRITIKNFFKVQSTMIK